jgi:acyl-homoserine-lactone acylase
MTRQAGAGPRRVVVRAVGVLVVLAATACSGDDATAPTTSTSTTSTTAAPATTAAPTTSTTIVDDGYRASITRTEYGVAHIVADDWGSLGFGQGYAFAQDRACTLIDQVIKVRGERSLWFGPGDNDANLVTDFAYRHLGLHDDADQRFGDQPTEVAEIVDGYVAGFNAELAEQGPSGWCVGEPWVQPITSTDLYAYLNDVTLYASSGALIEAIGQAQPPDATSTDTTAIVSVPPASITTDSTVAASVAPSTTALGSNGWAIGADASSSGGGLLLANPHFPWEGEKRLWESHLTLTTGELDAYGVTLSGVPGILIGFNRAVGWTHTVSAGHRMTLYQLQLVPGAPTTFRYGDTTEDLVATEITVQVLQPDGSIADETRTMWASHYGPMLELPFGWTDTTAYTYRDANIDNTDIVAQFLGMATATSMDAFIDAHRIANGIPWVNTIATSADGRAWYADTAATPNLSAESIAAWQAQVATEGSIAALVDDNGAVLLDGSDPVNEWVDDPAATRPGILPFDQQPQLERSDYVFNSNDSHWLANPDELLTGYSPLTGPEAVPQSARTRMNAILLVDPAQRGDDDRFDLAEIEAAILSQRSLHAELLLPGVLEACDRTHLVLVDGVPYSIVPACDVLRAWNGRYDIEARGAALWREYLVLFSRAARQDKGPLYRRRFDPEDPVGTPNRLNDDLDVEVLKNLGIAAKAMTAAGFAIDAKLGDVQFDNRAVDGAAAGVHIPLGGGTEVDGTASIVGCCSDAGTLAPKGDPGTFADAQYFSDLGYPVTTGNSFMMALQFTPEGPVARAVLTYGQPDDATSPDFVSQTQLYSAGTFRAVRFEAADIAADPTAVTIEVRGQR